MSKLSSSKRLPNVKIAKRPSFLFSCWSLWRNLSKWIPTNSKYINDKTKSPTLSQNRIPKSLMCPIFQNPLKLDIKGYATRHKIIKILKSAIRILEINLVLGIETFIWRKINSKLGFVWFLKDKKEKKCYYFPKKNSVNKLNKNLYLLLLLGMGLSNRHFLREEKKRPRFFWGEGEGRREKKTYEYYYLTEKTKRKEGLWTMEGPHWQRSN